MSLLGFDFGGDSDLNTSASFGTGSTFDYGRDASTVGTNAVDSMGTPSSGYGSGWSTFWQDTGRALVGYTIAKDAAQSGLRPVGPANPGLLTTQQGIPRWMVFGAAGLAIYLIAKKG